jgi:hypothetical protein
LISVLKDIASPKKNFRLFKTLIGYGHAHDDDDDDDRHHRIYLGAK